MFSKEFISEFWPLDYVAACRAAARKGRGVLEGFGRERRKVKEEKEVEKKINEKEKGEEKKTMKKEKKKKEKK